MRIAFPSIKKAMRISLCDFRWTRYMSLDGFTLIRFCNEIECSLAILISERTSLVSTLKFTRHLEISESIVAEVQSSIENLFWLITKVWNLVNMLFPFKADESSRIITITTESIWKIYQVHQVKQCTEENANSTGASWKFTSRTRNIQAYDDGWKLPKITQPYMRLIPVHIFYCAKQHLILLFLQNDANKSQLTCNEVLFLATYFRPIRFIEISGDQ